MGQQTTAADAHYQALLQLLRTADAIWDASRNFFQQWDLSPSQFNILNLLHSNDEGLSQSELGRQLITHRSNVTGLVDRLEARGLVQRKDASADRRAYRVLVTKAGVQLMNQILPHYYRKADQVWAGVSRDRISELLSALGRVAQNASGVAGPPSNSAGF
jgi:DNA-binding MarR family transcriptional regulator